MMDPISKLMESTGITQAEVARRARISTQYVNDIVRKRSGIGKGAARKLVAAFPGEVSLGELLAWQPKRKAKPKSRNGEAAA